MQTRLPLEGIKVIEFTSTAVGPIIGKYLADCGATVVRLESHKRLDVLRFAGPFKDRKPGYERSGYNACYNSSKYTASVNLGTPGGLAIARKLVLWSDIVIENLKVGMMSKWKLDYANTSKLKPELIYLSSTQQGQTGPHANVVGWGIMPAALAGMVEICGWADRDPVSPSGSYPDWLVPRFGLTLIMAALLSRKRTGKGLYMDVSQFECTLLMLAPAMMDYFSNGHDFQRRGNRVPYAAPHGVFPCSGDDNWVAVAVTSDAEWQALCRVMGKATLAEDPKFVTLTARKQNEDELDEIVAQWTMVHEAVEVERILQKAGIAASYVKRCTDLFEDAHLNARGHFTYLNHPVIGKHAYENPSFVLSRTPVQARWAAPLVGQDNSFVLGELLGMNEEEISDAFARGELTSDADVVYGQAAR
ncbi:MAG: CoA transferase [Chloroflexi bacterium]|nr:CoA transferase [Chloroflexota bacterium]